MNYIYITYSHPDISELVETLEEHFALTDEVRILASSVTFRKQQGVVVLEWDGMVDLGFLHLLNIDIDVVDYAILSAPGIVRRETGTPPFVLRGPYPRGIGQQGE